jgi:putative component of membrane protein insertase Oxa1/YidC/SpoIIIJ protein YidD
MERVGAISSLDPSSCRYSPKCVEGEFSEVRMHDRAWITL